jgi:hypothetical protein
VRIYFQSANDIGSARQGNFTPDFEDSVLTSSFLFPSVSGCLLSLCLSSTICCGTFRTFVDSLDLRLRLYYNAGRNLAAADGCDQPLETRDFADIRKFVQKETRVDGQSTAVFVVCLVTEKVKKL